MRGASARAQRQFIHQLFSRIAPIFTALSQTIGRN
jgi:hypothetical protein